jgi:ferredoxin
MRARTAAAGAWRSVGPPGCGRCITWCPVGIDVTEEIAAIRATDGGLDPDAGREAS